MGLAHSCYRVFYCPAHQRIVLRRLYSRRVEKEQIIEQLRQFVDERDWKQFHSPENLAKSVSIEAAELLELFQWGSEADEARIIDELADVLTYCILLANHFGLDPYKLVIDKLEKTKEKYPVAKSKGKSDKYDRL